MEKIAIVGLSKSFSGKTVFRELNLTLDSGGKTCIMGPSGAGKTTLLRILMGLECADGGSVTGLEKKRFSAVFQEERLCEYMTAPDNIRLVAPAAQSQTILRELACLGMEDCDSLPVSALSGGMRRRVSILRALAADYDVLFLDEPFKGLDDAVKMQVIAHVRERTAGKTVLFVTHDRAEAEALGAKLVMPFYTREPVGES
ncbi:MAG: ATP-binding cassette domain-containing protein [Lachnospiraceae bacterium]|nr:ATP-binding cassette domain-containing protein [Lachnospiraceae bacterium]